MQIGMCLPYTERDYNRQTTLAWCRGIDAGPFSSLSCGERITSCTQDMRIVLAAAAALTGRCGTLAEGPFRWLAPTVRALNEAAVPPDLYHARNRSVGIHAGWGGFPLEDCGNDEDRILRLLPGSLAQPIGAPAPIRFSGSAPLTLAAACDN